MDSVDDLEGAEDLAGTLAAALESLCAVIEDDAPAGDAMSAVEQAMARWRSYCRATCNPNDDDEGCTNEYCSCPCHSREEVKA